MTVTYFFTGFPGFLGTELIASLLPSKPEVRALCLVQAKFKSLAEQQRAILIARHPSLKDRIDFIEGDITQPGLGLNASTFDFSAIQQIFHLAAVYDLSALPEIAHKVNVLGTEHMLAFAEQCTNLKRFQYVSTCYVSGKYKGDFTENDLDKGQSFNNHYDETKFLAEVAVRAKIKSGLPITIYRPSVVMGNSQTGETQKFDGPYYVIQFLLRQPKIALLPSIGNPKAHTLNVVPSDFVIRSICYLSQREDTIGKTFHLSDPNALTIHEFVKELERALRKKIITVPMPLAVAKQSFELVPGLQNYLKIPASTLDYFAHPTHYLANETQKVLAEGGIVAPKFSSYSERLIDFMIKNPSLRTHAMT